MSRSYRKHDCVKAAGKRCSNKKDRTAANKRMRRRANCIISSTGELDIITLPTLRDVSDPWDFPSDGLALYCDNPGTGREYYKYFGK